MSTRRSAASVVLLLTLLGSCAKKRDNEFQGWVEADLIFVSPDEQGRVQTMNVREGDQVVSGAPLFTLDADLQQADLGVAEAAQKNARRVFDRAQQLLKSGSGTQQDFDAAQATLREADARVSSAQTRLARRKLASPVTGAVQKVYYRPGETVPASHAIISLLPPSNVKVRFFVGEALLPRIAIGDAVRVSCDGCAGELEATITFIAERVEFTPPVIYSREERSKLVSLVEARPARPDQLRVGQPVSVSITPRERAK